jgi:signal peptidase I
LADDVALDAAGTPETEEFPTRAELHGHHPKRKRRKAKDRAADEARATGAAEDESDDDDDGIGFWRETVIIVASALIVSFLIKTFVIQAFFIPSQSMRETLEIGDRVMVSRFVPQWRAVRHGDIVVFLDPGDWLDPYAAPDRGPLLNAGARLLTLVGLLPQDSGEHLIKRAIGLPGDHVTCCDADGLVEINGVAITEPYLRPGSIPSQDDFDVTVPADMLFVMGDNRQDSADSRYNTDKPYGGFVPMDNVVGTAFAKVWPFSRASLLRNPAFVFSDVPAANSGQR